MYKGITYGLRTLALAAIAGCGSTESKLENEVIKQTSAPSTLELPDELIGPEDLQKRLEQIIAPKDEKDMTELRLDVEFYRERMKELGLPTLEETDDPVKLREQRDWYTEKMFNLHIREMQRLYPMPLNNNQPYVPRNAIIVGDQADGSDVVGAVDIPQKFSTEPLIPPYEPEVPWSTYTLIALGLVGAYLIGHIIGKRNERKKSREMVDGLVKHFGTGCSVDDLLRTPPPN